MFFILNYKDLIYSFASYEKSYGQKADKFMKNRKIKFLNN
jgi:hypothetical protein